MLHLRMPFGKHKGELVANVPTSYLRWCLRECDLDKPLRDSITAALSAREPSRGYSRPEPEGGEECRSVVDVRSTLKAWLREMTLRFHPDRTLDDGKAMSAINNGYERLQELFGVSR